MIKGRKNKYTPLINVTAQETDHWLKANIFRLNAMTPNMLKNHFITEKETKLRERIE